MCQQNIRNIEAYEGIAFFFDKMNVGGSEKSRLVTASARFDKVNV